MNYPHCYTLNNGVVIPALALGTWLSPDGQPVIDSIHDAIDAGYRSVDTARCYENEVGVGEGIRTCGLKREELYVTTKIWNADQGYEETLRAFEESERRLNIGYIDMILIHWPVPRFGKYVDTYKALEKLYKDGRVRAIGVCNFMKEHLDAVLENCSVVPAVNQIEMHPMLIQPELMEHCKKHNIQIEAYSPLMHGGAVLGNELIASVGKKYGKSTAQVTLRYLFQLGARILVKSLHKQRIIENQEIFDFSLSAEDMAQIAALNNGTRTCGDPYTMHYARQMADVNK